MHIIRRATIADAAALAMLAEDTFRATFEASNSADNMNAHCQSSYSKEIQANEIAAGDRLTFVAVVSGQLIGYAQLRWNLAPHCISGESPGEIQRLYVASLYHGKGIAQDLMNTCINEMTLLGYDVVWLGVWERNPRAISFYKKFGFTEVGEHIFTLGGDPQRDILMEKFL